MSSPDKHKQNRQLVGKYSAGDNADNARDNTDSSSRQSRRSDGTGGHTTDMTCADESVTRRSARTYNTNEVGCRRGICVRELTYAGGDPNSNSPTIPALDSPARAHVTDDSHDDPDLWDEATLKERLIDCVIEVHMLHIEAGVRRRANRDEVKRILRIGQEDRKRTHWKRDEVARLVAARTAYNTVIREERRKLECESIRNKEEMNQKENVRQQRIRANRKGTLIARQLCSFDIPADKCDEYKSVSSALNAQQDKQKDLSEKIDWYERKLLEIRKQNENSCHDAEKETRTIPDGCSMGTRALPDIGVTQPVNKDARLPTISVNAAGRHVVQLAQRHCRRAADHPCHMSVNYEFT